MKEARGCRQSVMDLGVDLEKYRASHQSRGTNSLLTLNVIR